MLNVAKQILTVYSLAIIVFLALDYLKQFVECKGPKKSLKLELRICCLIPVIILLDNLF